jgi:hypothetical protein
MNTSSITVFVYRSTTAGIFAGQIGFAFDTVDDIVVFKLKYSMDIVTILKSGLSSKAHTIIADDII